MNRAHRSMDAGHGGQILVSHVTAELARDQLPEGARLVDLGEHRLPDVPRPERILQLVAPGLAERFPPLRTLEAVPTNLPQPRTSFVGRQRALELLTDLVGEQRLVTLTGTGGAGKTRLAIEVGRAGLDTFPDGVRFADLAPLTDEVLVAKTVAPARLLLVVDNCEHIWPVGSLSLPAEDAVGAEDAEAMRLLLDRARAVRPDLELTAETRATVDWSYDLLDEDERVLLRRLSVFSGGATLSAVEDICSGGLEGRSDLLARLAIASTGMLIVNGHFDEAERWYTAAQTGAELPAELAAQITICSAWMRGWSGGDDPQTMRDEVVPQLTAAVDLLPEDHPAGSLAWFFLAGVETMTSLDPAAIERAMEVPGWSPAHDAVFVLMDLAIALHLAGEDERALEAITPIVGRRESGWRYLGLITAAIAAAGLGHPSRADDHLERARR